MLPQALDDIRKHSLFSLFVILTCLYCRKFGLQDSAQFVGICDYFQLTQNKYIKWAISILQTRLSFTK